MVSCLAHSPVLKMEVTLVILYSSAILCPDIYSGFSLHNLYKLEIFISFIPFLILKLISSNHILN
jgi:hypothetical protein